MPLHSRLLVTALLSGFLFLAACEDQQPAELETAWGRQVAVIAAGETRAARGAAIIARLEALGVPVEKHVFESDGLAGENILATVGGPADGPLLLIGAHYDRVDTGTGATDNASGSAVVLELAEALKQSPLHNYRVVVAFWDLEEAGLLGSKAWVSSAGDKPALYINFDVFGWGDTLWMMAPDANLPIAQALRITAGAAGMRSAIGDKYPPTDHLAFLAAGWPAVSFSLIEGETIPDILTMFSGEEPAEIPKVLQVIHTPADRLDQIVERDVQQALPVIEATIREWDANGGTARLQTSSR